MAIETVLKMGDPRLLRRAKPVEEYDTPELQELVNDMIETMRALNGAGLAAPQIGVDLQLVIFEVGENPRYPEVEAIPLTVLINPVLTPIGDEIQEDWEGCLSIPGMRGLVPRYLKLHYSAFDIRGGEIAKEVEGFHARVVQHECDHLLGMLYPMRIRDLRNFGYSSALFPDRPCLEE
ncbi:MAG TPA: peptide deformylase [Burkholderiales bacterium]|nr:peptide deformylase [Burkholderiales bacterium]